MDADNNGKHRPQALALLASERPRNLGWFGAAGLLFGDWGTSRLYVLGIAFAIAGRSSFYLIALLGVVGALLLFADYTITASLSAVDAFHYFGLGQHSAQVAESADPGAD